jgi:poly-gamma-glutamate system protein
MEVPSLTRIFSRAATLGRRVDSLLVLLAVLGIGFHLLTQATRHMKPQPYMDDKMAASTQAVRCFEAIRETRVGATETLDKENDPEASGLIGQEFTLITTDRGVLDSKLTTANPNFAAVFVEYFRELNLKPGDPVAIAMTGSFPALNISMLTAAERLQLKPIVITSAGSSMWGANDPKFTWLDMEKLLNDRGLLHTRSVAASIGGSNDRGRGLSPKGRVLLRDAIVRNGIPFISEPTLEQSIVKRIDTWNAAAGTRGIKAYVNIGGGSASVGNAQNANLIPAGINRQLKPYNWTQRGALHQFARKRVPVIHILNIESIATVYGLPLTPEAIPPVGEGDIFHKQAYDLRVALPAFVIYLVLCFGVLRARNRAASAAREVAAPLPIAGMSSEPIGERSGG